MNIGIWTPAYRYWVTSMHRNTAVCDAVWALSNGHVPHYWDDHGVNIPRLRNRAVRAALDRGYDRLMMLDADCSGPPGVSVLGRLMRVMDEHECAAAALPFRIKDGEMVNVDPAQPGEVYQAETACTGAILLDLEQLKQVEPPWFVDVVDEHGIEKLCGQDVYLCRLLAEHGLTVWVDYRLPAGVHLRPHTFSLE